MITKALQITIMVYVIGAFFKLVQAGARRPALRDPQTGDVVLQFHAFLVWTMGAIAVLGPLAMVVLSFIIPFRSETEVLVPIIMGLFFALLGGTLFLYLARRRLRFSKEGVTSEYVFRGTMHMPWDQVEKIKLALNQQELFLFDGQGRKTRIHIWLVGVKEATPLLREHLPEAVQRDHQDALTKFYKVVER